MVNGELENYRKDALTAAKELTYPQDTLNRIVEGFREGFKDSNNAENSSPIMKLFEKEKDL